MIPNGVDTNFFCPLDSVSDGDGAKLKTARHRIVCVARHHPVKNLELLLNACALLRDRRVEFHCVIVGDGPGRTDLEAERVRLALDTYVELTGEIAQDEVLALWRSASIAVLSSHSEGMPISLIEAAACQVPAVATRVGGVGELIEDGVTGLLTAPGDATALADALQRLLKDPRLAATMGRAARGVVERNFSLKLQVDRLVTLWQSLLKRPGAPRRDELEVAK